MTDIGIPAKKARKIGILVSIAYPLLVIRSKMRVRKAPKIAASAQNL